MPEPQKAPAAESGAGRLEAHDVNELFSFVYEELRRLASFVRKNEANATISSTTLVHKAWLKLKDSPHLADTSPTHFKGIATKAMRQILVDEARRRGARKRGGAGEVSFVPLSDSVEELADWPEELLLLDMSLDELASFSPRQAQVVESRFFGGMDMSEIAAMLNVSESSVERDWRAARAWLSDRIRPHKE
ncbi:MAG TPA: ECF-type sigma factor [Bryobacteraceae bacterium]|nr:ECF-type sigma factor [Bryobacteraceae bacterium]